MSTTTDPPERLDAAAIDVLLVDDDADWVRLNVRELEESGANLRVHGADGAGEALAILDEVDDLDCVVSDYRMPEMDGLELFERVRDALPEVPFLLVTGEGSETVAADAIQAGVTDYLVKDPTADQTAQLANRIRLAVSQYRLRRSIRESEERYRTVVEQSGDAIAIVRDGEVVFANRRLADLVGPAAADGTLAEAVLPADREAFRSLLAGYRAGEGDDELHEIRFAGPAGAVRTCEFTGNRIAFDREPAVLLSIRDVTERRRRERELAWERELNRTVQRAVIESGTLEELEAAICEQLIDYGYELAWTGRPSGETVSPRAVRGSGGSYVDEGRVETDEPAVRAGRSGEAQFVDDVAGIEGAAWQPAALSAGFQSAAALPIVHEGVGYGVLAVYHARRGRFDRTERQLLTDLVDTLAYAIHSIEAERALSAPQVTEIELRLDGPAYYLNDVAAAPPVRSPELEISVDGSAPVGGGRFAQFLTVEGISEAAFRRAVGDHPAVADVGLVSDEGEAARFRVIVERRPPEAALGALGARVRSSTVTAEGTDLRVELPSDRDTAGTISALEKEFPGVSAEAVVEIRRSKRSREFDLTEAYGALTDKQANALRTAYLHGYFERPRKSSAEEVAEALGVTHTTFLQHLRIAQQKLLDSLYG